MQTGTDGIELVGQCVQLGDFGGVFLGMHQMAISALTIERGDVAAIDRVIHHLRDIA